MQICQSALSQTRLCSEVPNRYTNRKWPEWCLSVSRNSAYAELYSHRLFLIPAFKLADHQGQEVGRDGNVLAKEERRLFAGGCAALRLGAHER